MLPKFLLKSILAVFPDRFEKMNGLSEWDLRSRSRGRGGEYLEVRRGEREDGGSWRIGFCVSVGTEQVEAGR